MKNRDKISMFAFITVCILLISLFASGITVFADGTFNVYEHYEIDSYLTDTDFPDLNHFNFLAVNYSSYDPDNLLSTGLNISDSITDYPYTNKFYTWFNNEVVNCSADSFLVVDSTKTGSRLYYKIDNTYTNEYDEPFFKFSKANFGGSTNVWEINILNDSRCVDIDGDKYFMWGGYSTLYTIFNANIPIYEVDDIETTLTTRPTDNINPNYGSSNNIVDHTNFNPAFMFINCDSYYRGDGLITSIGFDKWQVEHKDEFYITWDYNAVVEGHVVLPGSTTNTMNFSKNGYKQSLTAFEDGRFKMALPEIFVTMYDGNIKLWDVVKDFNVKNVRNYGELGVEAGVNVGVDVGVSYTSPITLPLSGELDTFTFSTTATIYRSSDDKVCGSFGYNYDFLTGTGTQNTTFKNQEDINNDVSNYNHENNYNSGDTGYLDITDYQSNLPASNNYPAISGGSSAQGGSASAQGGVAYGSNVNNSVIVNTSQDPKAVVDYIKGQLVPTGDGVGFVDNLRTATESNEFIDLMSDTFSFVPATVWADLGFYFEIFLGILVASFVLRIILDLL